MGWPPAQPVHEKNWNKSHDHHDGSHSHVSETSLVRRHIGMMEDGDLSKKKNLNNEEEKKEKYKKWRKERKMYKMKKKRKKNVK